MVLQLCIIVDSVLVPPPLTVQKQGILPILPSHKDKNLSSEVKFLLVTIAGGKKPSAMLRGRHENRVRNGF